MMDRFTRWLLAGAAALAVAGAPLTSAQAAKDTPLNLKAERAGWMMGMYVGEEKGQPYPFILDVDPKSDARLKGIKPGDELIRFNGEQILSLSRTFEQAKNMRPNREVVVWVRRGAETLRFFVRVPRNPGAPPSESLASKEKKKNDEMAEEGSDKDNDKKKSKKRPPVVIKPIPADE